MLAAHAHENATTNLANHEAEERSASQVVAAHSSPALTTAHPLTGYVSQMGAVASTTHARELSVGDFARVVPAEPADYEAIAKPTALVQKFGTVVPGESGAEVAISDGLVIQARAVLVASRRSRSREGNIVHFLNCRPKLDASTPSTTLKHVQQAFFPKPATRQKSAATKSTHTD